MKTIKDLKKGDRFRFNDCDYTVRRCWIDEDKPLIAYDHMNVEERFYHEGLEIEKL